MNIRVAKTETPVVTNFSPALPDSLRLAGEARAPRGLFARLRAWASAAMRRRAVIAELNMLSDRDLADIGLTRADLPRVFDPEFVREHEIRRTAEASEPGYRLAA